jgi:hypothetical protein
MIFTRFRSPAIAAGAAAFAVGLSACGGSSSGPAVAPDAVAAVGHTQITKQDFNRQVAIMRSSAKAAGKTLPKPGTAAFHTQVALPAVEVLVGRAQLADMASTLGVSVSKTQIHAALEQAIAGQFQGSQSKYQAFLRKYGVSEQELVDLAVLPQLERTGIEQKLASQAQVSDSTVQAYYKLHQAQFKSPDSRATMFLLAGSKNDVTNARVELAAGKTWDTVAKKYAVAPGAPQTAGSFKASKGQVEANFDTALFSPALKTGQLSQPIVVSKSYASSALKGKCHPDCYFLIRPAADTVKSATIPYAKAKDQIRSLLSQQSQSASSAKLRQLTTAETKSTVYRAGYKPPPAPASTGGAAGGQ